MTTVVVGGALAVALFYAWRANVHARRERVTAAHLYRLARQMDERACQATLRPRTGDVVAHDYRNGSR